MEHPALRGRSILVVEDEVLIAMDIFQALESAGAHATMTTTVRHALILVEHDGLFRICAMSDEKQEPGKGAPKTWAGMPVSWDWKHWYKGLWNAEDDRPFPPKRVGVGWTINVRALLKKLRTLK
jgi:hypothetical protein